MKTVSIRLEEKGTVRYHFVGDDSALLTSFPYAPGHDMRERMAERVMKAELPDGRISIHRVTDTTNDRVGHISVDREAGKVEITMPDHCWKECDAWAKLPKRKRVKSSDVETETSKS